MQRNIHRTKGKDPQIIAGQPLEKMFHGGVSGEDHRYLQFCHCIPQSQAFTQTVQVIKNQFLHIFPFPTICRFYPGYDICPIDTLTIHGGKGFYRSISFPINQAGSDGGGSEVNRQSTGGKDFRSQNITIPVRRLLYFIFLILSDLKNDISFHFHQAGQPVTFLNFKLR